MSSHIKLVYHYSNLCYCCYFQKSRHELQGQREEAHRLVASVTGFEQKNPHIQMDQFREETSDLRATVDELLEKYVFLLSSNP